MLTASKYTFLYDFFTEQADAVREDSIQRYQGIIEIEFIHPSYKLKKW